MNDAFYSLASSTWDDKELEAIQRVMESNKYTMGKYVQSFEKEFAQYFGSKYSIMVNSGSSANLLAIASLFFREKDPIKENDEVIVPAISWSTTFFPLQQYGLKVKFVDVDLETLNFDLEKLSDSITEKTRIIFSVNLLGNPNDFSSIKEIISNRNIILLEDNCESMGAKYKNQFAGTFGLIGTFSSYFSHHISTMEGGLLLTNNTELYHILLSLRSHGWTRHLPKHNKVTGVKSDVDFEESFKFVLPGYNLRPIEMMGSIGTVQLKKLPKFVHIRRKNANYFNKKFGSLSNIIIQKELGESSWFGFSIILKENFPVNRETVIDFLTKNNIETRPIVSGNFQKNKSLKYFKINPSHDCKNADMVDTNGFFVGNHHFDLKPQIDRLHHIITSF